MKTGKGWGKKIVVLAVAMATSFVSSDPAQGSQTGGATLRVPAGSQGNEYSLPFVLHDGYLIIVEGRIGGLRRLRFVLDTGATHSVLRAGIAKVPEFGQRPIRVVNLDQVLTQELAEVEDFQLGPIQIRQVFMMISDLKYLREMAPDVDGIIGLDVLRMRSFTIDFGKRRITFGSPVLLRSSIAVEVSESYVAVEARMMERPVRLLVDTGVRNILLYRDRMGDRLPKLKIEQRIRGASLAGSASLEVVTLPRLLLSGTALRRQAVLLQNSPTGFLPGVDGYLSLAAIGASRFSFDFERNLLSWD